MKKIKEISVFFPTYNEEGHIKNTILSAQKVLKKIAQKYEIIIVNDGSTDKTETIVKRLAKKNSRLRLISHWPNQGYGAALKTGLKESKYSLICYTDSDGQFDFREIDKFLTKINQADLVIGFRIKRQDSLYRRFMAQVLRLTGIILFGLNVKDVDCGFKLLKRKVIETIGSLATASAITETELVARAQKADFKIEEVGVHHHSRQGGRQTGGNPSIIIRAALEGFKLWFVLNIVERKC